MNTRNTTAAGPADKAPCEIDAAIIRLLETYEALKAGGPEQLHHFFVARTNASKVMMALPSGSSRHLLAGFLNFAIVFADRIGTSEAERKAAGAICNLAAVQLKKTRGLSCRPR